MTTSGDTPTNVTNLMATILESQKEREQAINERMSAANHERDMAVKQLNELVEILSQTNEQLDTQVSDHGHLGTSSDDDETIFEFKKSTKGAFMNDTDGNGLNSEPDIDSVEKQLSFARMQLKHEIKLRLIQQKKSKR